MPNILDRSMLGPEQVEEVSAVARQVGCHFTLTRPLRAFHCAA